MKVFVSWSGERSKAVAEALAPWLRQVIQAIEPWISTGIKKGTRWGPEVSAQLEETRVGIICLTRDNLTEPWILFEAGALSKTRDALVATFLLDLDKTDVGEPLAQFQHTVAAEPEVRQLLHTLNALVRNAGERSLLDSELDEVFDLFWPKLKAKLDAIRPVTSKKVEAPIRSDSDILREILSHLRSSSRSEAAWEPPRRGHIYRIEPGPNDTSNDLVQALGGLPNVISISGHPSERHLTFETDRPSKRRFQQALEKSGLAMAKVIVKTASVE